MSSIKITKPFVFILCLLPFIWLIWSLVDGFSGPNPQEYANRFLGIWALRFLIMTLAITPIRKLFKISKLATFRRMIGLYAFFYAVLHVLSYIAFDQAFDWPAIWSDAVKRTYITIGILVLLMLIPLAITSTNKMIRRLGGKRWKALHRLIYPSSILAVVHFYMMTRADFSEPLVYGIIVAILLCWRVFINRTS